MKYVCRVCGTEFADLPKLIKHFESVHRDLLPEWFTIMKLEGRRPRLWRAYRDLCEEGLARGVRG